MGEGCGATQSAHLLIGVCSWTNAFVPYAKMPEYFEQYGRKEPQTTNHVPMSFAYGKPDLSFYELLAEDEAWVGSFLKGMAHVESRMPVTAGIYDFSWLVAEARARPDSGRAVLVDVGGGKGGAIRAIHREFPGLPVHRFVLEDRPETLEAGLALEEPELAGVRRVALDFHKDQPVKGAWCGDTAYASWAAARNSTNLVWESRGLHVLDAPLLPQLLRRGVQEYAADHCRCHG